MLRFYLFVAGISTCFIILGFGAVRHWDPSWKQFLRVGWIVLGLHQTGLIHIKWLSYEKVNLKRSHRRYFGVFLLGLTFNFGWILSVLCVRHGTFGHKHRPFMAGF
ncbi:cytochrome c biogenesis protein CcdA [Hungatella sp.]|uniref:cytochrome c biogenesis protein CcdA n=1 Tax=Hungatella sp. TaxID=2613924 RepID=UPI0039912E46